MATEDSKIRKKFNWAIILAALGIADSFWLLTLHMSHGALSNMCGVSSTVNCHVLSLREYSEWFGIPIPVFGGLFYALVLMISIRGRGLKGEQLARPVIYLYLLSWISLASTLYMASVSFFVLKTLCPYCSVLYVVSIALFIIARQAMKVINQPWGHLVSYDMRRAPRNRWVLSTLGAGAVILFFAGWFFKQSADHHALSTTTSRIVPVQNRMLGASGSKVLISTFSDFQCPHCKIAGEVFHQLEQEMRGKIAIVYKFFPLDATCNRFGGRHTVACKAAIGAYCGAAQEKFWPFHDMLYAEQESLNAMSFYEIARALQLNLPEFDRCMNDPQSLTEVKKDIEEGIALQLEGTPAIYINGKKYSGPPTVGALKAAIEEVM